MKSRRSGKPVNCSSSSSGRKSSWPLKGMPSISKISRSASAAAGQICDSDGCATGPACNGCPPGWPAPRDALSATSGSAGSLHCLPARRPLAWFAGGAGVTPASCSGSRAVAASRGRQSGCAGSDAGVGFLCRWCKPPCLHTLSAMSAGTAPAAPGPAHGCSFHCHFSVSAQCPCPGWRSVSSMAKPWPAPRCSAVKSISRTNPALRRFLHTAQAARCPSAARARAARPTAAPPRPPRAPARPRHRQACGASVLFVGDGGFWRGHLNMLTSSTG